MVEKSPNAFRTISEVAEVIDVPAHVLRFWESKFSQIKPVKRGGGRRYYRPNDIHLIRGIRDLLYSDGLTIKGAQKVLREQGVKHVIAMGEEAAGAPSPLKNGEIHASDALAETAFSDDDDTQGSAIDLEAPVQKTMFRRRTTARAETQSPSLHTATETEMTEFAEAPTGFDGKSPADVADAEEKAHVHDLFSRLGEDADVVKDPADLLSVDDLRATPSFDPLPAAGARDETSEQTPHDLARDNGDAHDDITPPTQDPEILRAAQEAEDFAFAPDRKARLKDVYARLQELRREMTKDD